MLFSSITFLYFFLPLVLLLYGVVPKQAKNFILCVASCVFYAWGEPVYLFLMLIQIVIAYGLTLMMEKRRDTKAGKVIFILAVLIPFASLFFFKYSSFVMRELMNLVGASGSGKKELPTNIPLVGSVDLLQITLPIGISFYTFQLVSYIVDVWRGQVAVQKSLLKLTTYVTLFPQLIAGPIVRYSEVEEEMANRLSHVQQIADGIVRFVIGLSKKVLIANVLGEFVQEVAGLSGNSIALAWGYALAVTLQIYFDFSGYSDMAIGLGAMFGFKFPENFNYPLISKDLTDFWRRWHMTLGGWFRDYVYIPLGGNRTSTVKWIRNIFIVWFLTGLWHGAGWNFIVWGLFFGVFLMVEKLLGKALETGSALRSGDSAKKSGVNGDRSALTLQGCIAFFVRHIYVLVAILVSFLIFNGATLEDGWEDIRNLWNAPVWMDTTSAYMLRNRAGILIVAVLAATPMPKLLWEKLEQIVKNMNLNKTNAEGIECENQGRSINNKCPACGYGNTVLRMLQFVLIAILLLLCTAYLIDGSFNPFLYFRF